MSNDDAYSVQNKLRCIILSLLATNGMDGKTLDEVLANADIPEDDLFGFQLQMWVIINIFGVFQHYSRKSPCSWGLCHPARQEEEAAKAS